MVVREFETWKPRFCRMVQSHWTILVSNYVVQTSESVKWSLYYGWVLTYQWTTTSKIQRMIHTIACSSLEAHPSPPYSKATSPFGILWEWNSPGGDFLMGLMGCSSVKAKGIYDGILRAAVKVVHGVLDTLEHRYRWGSRIARDTVVRVYDIRVCILNNMHFFPICALNFLS